MTPQRDNEAAQDEKLSYLSQLEGVPPESRVYLDEMGSALNLTLSQGRSRLGEPVYEATPTYSEGTVNTLAVLTKNGIEAVDKFTSTLNAERFIFYLGIYLLPLMTGGKVLIMDNHPVHCAKNVRLFLERHEIPYIYLPTYSPELNPIEEAFSKIKHYIRQHKPRAMGALFAAVDEAVKTVTQNDIIGYINHSEEFLEVTV